MSFVLIFKIKTQKIKNKAQTSQIVIFLKHVIKLFSVAKKLFFLCTNIYNY